ncbi:uncharacterized protein ARB_01414 [Trichophyton benhamiae CBS 112371]|uniref:Mannosyltransferase n=1 Tax=Arthroderma benhamiae (strain ATCC MYA-4681 / CBS 112371) TaxID=663331 RepID=D4AYZ5_ARTBC|nr:uncharacterized protein ARB_01414 [Trichophyton benhamiae CBS 112371]EFE31815.1 hypothetical protein ARB_01414 [Trichophyton benhamiae CBS 112371]
MPKARSAAAASRGHGGGSQGAQQRRRAADVFLLLLALRIANGLLVRTFFQPDEFFQSLEPAWGIAFGRDSGAWITWEWEHQLRSSIHPYLFAAVYKAVDAVANVLQLSPLLRGDLLIAGPKVVQGIISAVGDYYTWNLGRRIYNGRPESTWIVRLPPPPSPLPPFFAVLYGRMYIFILTGRAARFDGVESLAVVLLYSDVIKLPGDLPYRHCPISVAMAVVSPWQVAAGDH